MIVDRRSSWVPQRVKTLVRAMRRRRNFDEVVPIASLLRGASGRTMVDVGAHHGGALTPFAASGWQVVAFEPDSTNRAKLIEAWGSAPNVRVDARAVSDVDGREVSLYRSEVSSGISGLSAFHVSHRAAETVKTVTLRTFLNRVQVPAIDFLKVDTEGYDLFVLRGFPWEMMHPRVILCEFENRKTVPLGYRTEDLLELLVVQGYTVIISEWCPVIEYGRMHKWRSFGTHPKHVASDGAWGNLIGVRDRKDIPAIQARLSRHALAHRLVSRIPKANASR